MAGKQADIKVGVITNYDDKGLKQAESGLKGFKSSIADAEGAGGKLKAGWGSVTDSIKANAGGLAVGAGAALIAFGVKAVGAFTDTAKAAIDMGAATGLSTEQASRWIAVADDMGVSADALQAGIGKIGKTLDGAQWEKYGIATRDAGGHARDVNDILLDSFDKLGKITNETERAKAGNELFGKGYANLAPLIGKSREEMEKYLGSVEKGQVITDKEAKKAEKFRLAQDALNDALKDVQLAVGGVVAELAPMIEKTAATVTKLTDLVAVADDATSSFGGLANVVNAVGNPISAYEVATAAVTDVVDESNLSLAELREQYIKAGADLTTLAIVTQRWYDQHRLISPAVQETERETRRLGKSTEDLAADEEALAAAEKEAKDQLEKYKAMSGTWADSVKADVDQVQAEWAELTGQINDDSTWLDLQTSFDELGVATAAAWQATADGAVDAEQQTRNAQKATNDQKLAVIDYVSEVLKMPKEKATNILALIDQGKLAEAEEALRILTRDRGAGIFAEVRTGGSGGGIKALAAGGIVPARPGGTIVRVGEGGRDEGIVPLNSDGSIPGGGGGVVIQSLTINMPVGSDGNAIIRQIKQFERRNGPGWRAS